MNITNISDNNNSEYKKNNKRYLFLNKQAKLAFFYMSVCYTAGVMIALIFDTGINSEFYTYGNILQLIVIALLHILSFTKKVSYRKAINAFLLIMSTEVAAEMIYEATVNLQQSSLFILTRLTIMMILTSGAVLAYLRFSTFYISILSVVTYIVSTIITQNIHLSQYTYIVILAFLGLAILGNKIYNTLYLIEDKDISLQDEKNEIIVFAHLGHQDWNVLIESLKNKHISADKTLSVLKLINKNISQRIASQARQLVRDEQIYSPILLSHYPNLTCGELEVCLFIIRGMTVSQISAALNITLSTVTTIRSNIRTKMNLPKDINLRQHINSVIHTQNSSFQFKEGINI